MGTVDNLSAYMYYTLRAPLRTPLRTPSRTPLQRTVTMMRAERKVVSQRLRKGARAGVRKVCRSLFAALAGSRSSYRF